MRNPSGCTKLGAGLIVSLGLLAVCAYLFFSYSSYQGRQARAQYAPPTVLITDPGSGTSATAGSYLNVSATATGTHPIVRVELWLDGELMETQNSEQSEGLSPFYADFAVLIPSEGAHMLFVRAVDGSGMIGQSVSVSLIGEPKPAEPFLAVTAQEGQGLEDIANAYAVGPEILQALNPDLGSQPPAGALVKLPFVPEDGPPEGPAPATPGNAPVVIPNVPMLPMGTALPGQWIAEPFANNPPAAPTGLQAEMKGCKITLRWNDNADNEENYYVYIVPVTSQSFAIPSATLKPSPSTGPAWTELEPTGVGSFSLWVEAANPYGAQPSNIVWVYAPFISSCSYSAEKAKSLSVSVTDITVDGNYDKAYCYVSLENQPEQRIPSGDNNFVQLQGGKSGASTYLAGYNLPVPADGVLDLSGKCLGWAGNTLGELGTFSAKFPRETWTGDRQTLQGSTYQIGIKLISSLEGGFQEMMQSTDPTLPIPYDLREDPPPNDAWTQALYPPARLLRWKWDGDPNKIDSFTIFLNGKPISAWYSMPHTGTQQMVRLPGECGKSVRWQVAARAGKVISGLSAPVQYDLPPCKMYLRVSFDNIELLRTDDGWPSGEGACDTLDAYYQISVRDVTRSFWGGGFYLPLKCRTYTFGGMAGGYYKQAYGAEPHVITIPLADGEDVYSIWIKAHFWDYDSTSGDDTIGSFAEHPMGAPLIARDGEKWPECEKTYTTGDHITGEGRSHITFSFAFYPNACRDTPPETGLR